jgi:deoxycytidine triphosphate deaminase
VTSGSPHETTGGKARLPDRAGTLTRARLKQLADSGAIRNSDGPVLIGQDTLKLHVGRIAWVSRDTKTCRQQVDPVHPIRISPGDTITVVTQEEVRVPLGLTGCAYPRGRLLPLGVLSTAVHIDPGFEGHLRVVIMNVGRRVVDLPYGYEVARLQLSTLTEALSTPYVGVNAELEYVNPQAEDIVLSSTIWKNDSQEAVDALANRIQLLESYVRDETARRRRRRVFFVITAALAIIAGLAFSTMIIGRSLGGASVRDLVIQVMAGTLTGVVAITGSLARQKFRGRLKLWISADVTNMAARGESLKSLEADTLMKSPPEALSR